MDVPARRVHPILLAALVLVAVCGYLAGSHRPASSAPAEVPPGPTRVLSNAGLLLEYPDGWRRASTDPVPSLRLQSSVTVLDGSNPGEGLLSGRVAAGEPAPLPAAFLAALRGTPHAEVVNLLATQAYRYSELAVPSLHGTLDVYVIPSEAGGRVMACFGERLSQATQQCEKTIAAVTLTGGATPSLTPEPAYAKALAAIVSALEAERARRRGEMASSDAVASVGSAAASMGASATTAARAVASLEPPQAASRATSALAAALRTMAGAYSSLAEAAQAESVGSYDTDREAVSSAEAGVSRALETFTLLGYGRG